ncbi:MAG: hypothetical protein VB099_15805 [Candidatus Limiplasma sp.]|nr:hypothetical protein [Candidatus Limiplasma sp.]
MRGKEQWRIPVALMLALCLLSSLFPLMGSLADAIDGSGEEIASTPVPTEAPKEDITYPGLTLEAEIGYDGRVTYLRKLPLRVTLKNQGGNLAGTLAVNIYRNTEEYDRYEMPVSVASQAEVQAQLLVELTTKQKDYQVEFLVDGKVIASRTLLPSSVMDPKIMLVATLSEKKAVLSQFIFSDTKDPLKRGEFWQVVPLTADSFPQDPKMLEAFAFLAVDGMDLSTLSASQQKALKQWLQKGGIVFLGGGAQAGLGFPFFTQFTGITAGSTAQSPEDITPSLLSYVKAAEPTLGGAASQGNDTSASQGGAVLLTELKNAKNLLASSQDTGLLDMTRVGDGVIFTAAFSLSDKPLVDWLSTTAFWQRVLVTAMGDQYKKISDLYLNYYSRSNEYIDGSILGMVPLPNDSSFLIPLVLLLVFVALVGFGSYWVLKKKDKRDLMWATIPALSVVFVVLLLVMGNNMSFRQPVAVISGIVNQDTDGMVNATASVGMSVAERTPVAISSQQGRIRAAQESYYTGEEPPRNYRLRYIYTQGEQDSITFPANASRTVNSFFVDGVELPEIRVKGDCWWEKDGMHITLVNEGEYPFQAGHVVTPMGYCAVPALLPGEAASCVIAHSKNEQEEKKNAEPTYNAYGNPSITAGTLLTTAQQKYINIYSMTGAIVYPEQYTDGKAAAPKLSGQEQTERSLQSSLYNYCINARNMYEDSAAFYYMVLDDSLFPIQLTANGEAVRRSAQRNIISVKLQYHAVSESGLVNYPKGLVPIYEAAAGSQGNVRGAQITGVRYRYYRLQDKPMFCFAIPQEARDIQLNLLEIGIDYSYSESDMQIWNAKTGEWQLIDPKKELLKQVEWNDCLTPEGELFVQYMPSTSNGDGYAEIASPYMVLEGSVR